MCFNEFLARVKKQRSIFRPTKGVKIYCDLYDRHEVTVWGTCSGPASSPPEIDYDALDADGLILVTPQETGEYRQMCRDRADFVDTIQSDMTCNLIGIIPFEFGDDELKVNVRYAGELWGAACLVFDLAVVGDNVVGRRPASY